MGEARRQKLAGWVLHTVRLECFIAQSKHSDAHCVYLGIGRSKEDIQLQQGNNFSKIVDAWTELCQCKKALETFKYHDSQTNDNIGQNFWKYVIKVFGVVPSDDAMYRMEGDTKKTLDWIAQGGNPFLDKPPVNVRVKIINPLVQKIYKALMIKPDLVDGDLKSLCGNPDDVYVFSVGKSHEDPILESGSNNMFLFSSYVTAAYVADHLNEQSQNFLERREMIDLVQKSNKLQGKI